MLNQGVAAWAQAVNCGAEGEATAMPLHCVVGVTPGVDFVGASSSSAGKGKGAKAFGRKQGQKKRSGGGGGGGGGGSSALDQQQQWVALVKKMRVEMARLLQL